jgi:hypothetical protein
MAGASPVSYFDRRPPANDPPIFLISSATAGRQINGGYWFRILGCEQVGRIIVDIDANIGVFTLYASRKAP